MLPDHKASVSRTGVLSLQTSLGTFGGAGEVSAMFLAMVVEFVLLLVVFIEAIFMWNE